MSSIIARWTSLAVAGLLVVGLAGGAVATVGAQGDGYTADSEITVTVTDDGEVESEHVVYELPAELYQGMEMVAGMDGHDSVADYFGSMAVETRAGIGGYENADDSESGDSYENADDSESGDSYENADDSESGDSYVVELTLVDIETDDLEDVETSVADDGTVSFEMVAAEDPVYQSDAMDEETIAATGEYSVVVEMPDDVSETNALETEGAVAVWHLHQDMPDRLQAESGPSAGENSGADDGTDADTTDGVDEDGITGFGSVVGVLGIVLAVLTIRRRA